MGIITIKKLCITTVVNKGYQRYIPAFVYFCFKSYPDYSIKLFLTEELAPEYRSLVSMLESLGNLVIIENAFSGFPKTNQELKMLRWVLDKEDFDDYSNIYVGDIDILICREDPTLEEQHIRHCENTGLAYSNSVRPNSKRLSGLHFIKKDDYYQKMLPIIKKYTADLKNGVLRKVKNENMLYDMIYKAGFGFPETWFRPHHGLHLGLWRKGHRVIEQRYWDVINRDAYKNYYKFYRSLIATKDLLLDKIISTTVNREIKDMEKSLAIEFDKELKEI